MKHIKDLGNGALLISNCVISYPHLFTARRAGRPGQETGEPRYSANFILPLDLDQEDQQLLSDTVNAAIVSVFPAGPPPGLKMPWKEAADADESLRGRICIAASSTQDQPPGVFTQTGPMAAEQQSQLFAGCIVNAHVRVYAYTRGSNGVTFGLNDVQLVDNQNVTRLDNRKSGAEVFGVPGAGFPSPSAPVPNQPAPAVPPAQQVTPQAAPMVPPLPGAPGVPGPAPVTPDSFV